MAAFSSSSVDINLSISTQAQQSQQVIVKGDTWWDKNTPYYWPSYKSLNSACQKLVDAYEKKPESLQGVHVSGNNFSSDFFIRTIPEKITSPFLISSLDLTSSYNFYFYELRLAGSFSKKVNVKDLVTQKFAEIVLFRRDRLYETAKDKIKNRKHDVETYEKHLNTSITALAEAEKTLQATKKSTATVESILQEFEKLKLMPQIEKIGLSSNRSIVVYTKMLTAAYAGNKNWKIGRFKFVINLPSSAVYAFNLDFTWCGYCDSVGTDPDHTHSDNYSFPCVDSGGSICFGRNGDDIYQMIDNGSVYQLVDFLLVFFGTFPHDNNANPYVPFDKWAEERIPRAKVKKQPLLGYLKEEIL